MTDTYRLPTPFGTIGRAARPKAHSQDIQFHWPHCAPRWNRAEDRRAFLRIQFQPGDVPSEWGSIDLLKLAQEQSDAPAQLQFSTGNQREARLRVKRMQ